MKRKMFLLNALVIMFTDGIFWSCQNDEFVTDAENASMLKGGTVPLIWTDVCADGSNDLVLTLSGTGNKQIQQYVSGGWVQFAQASGGTTPLVGTLQDVTAGTYTFRYKVGGGGYSENVVIVIEECCTPGFTYVDNGNGSYTFTLVPDEDVEDALLQFTFAQGVAVSGLNGFTHNGNPNDPKSSVWSATMDLNECETLTWTVTLTADCNGRSGASNVWTDFKINDISQKADSEDKFVQDCQ